MTTAIAKQASIDGTKAIATKVALYSTAPANSDTAGTAITGATGLAVTWSGNSGTASVTGLTAGQTVAGLGLLNASDALIAAVALGSSVTLTAGAANVTVTLS